jgi:two-component system phosphate regulon response regulator PhoB
LAHPWFQFKQQLWRDADVDLRTVDVHVGRLRKALNADGANDPIRTVRSAGYSSDHED